MSCKAHSGQSAEGVERGREIPIPSATSEWARHWTWLVAGTPVVVSHVDHGLYGSWRTRITNCHSPSNGKESSFTVQRCRRIQPAVVIPAKAGSSDSPPRVRAAPICSQSGTYQSTRRSSEPFLASPNVSRFQYFRLNRLLTLPVSVTLRPPSVVRYWNPTSATVRPGIRMRLASS